MVLYYFLAFAAAAAIAIQAPINSRLGQALSDQPLLAALISFSVGTIALFILCLFRHQKDKSLPESTDNLNLSLQFLQKTH